MLGKIFNMLLYSSEKIFEDPSKLLEIEELGKRGTESLYQLAKALRGIKVIPPNGSGATFTTDSLSKMLKKYAKREDLVRIVLPNFYSLLSPKKSLLCIVMEDSAGDLYYTHITSEKNSLVARLSPEEINKLEESEVLCIIQPQEDGKMVAIVSKYIHTSEKPKLPGI